MFKLPVRENDLFRGVLTQFKSGNHGQEYEKYIWFFFFFLLE